MSYINIEPSNDGTGNWTLTTDEVLKDFPAKGEFSIPKTVLEHWILNKQMQDRNFLTCNIPFLYLGKKTHNVFIENTNQQIHLKADCKVTAPDIATPEPPYVYTLVGLGAGGPPDVEDVLHGTPELPKLTSLNLALVEAARAKAKATSKHVDDDIPIIVEEGGIGGIGDSVFGSQGAPTREGVLTSKVLLPELAAFGTDTIRNSGVNSIELGASDPPATFYGVSLCQISFSRQNKHGSPMAMTIRVNEDDDIVTISVNSGVLTADHLNFSLSNSWSIDSVTVNYLDKNGKHRTYTNNRVSRVSFFKAK